MFDEDFYTGFMGGTDHHFLPSTLSIPDQFFEIYIDYRSVLN